MTFDHEDRELLFGIAVGLTLFCYLYIICGCTKKDTPQQLPPALLEVTTCATPEEFGAVAGDGRDDREPLQAAIRTGRCVRGTGPYEVARSPFGGSQSVCSIVIDRAIEFGGTPEAPMRLEMLDGALLSGALAPSDWVLLCVRAGARVHDVALDGAKRVATGEQTHLLQVEARGIECRGATVEDVTLNLPPIGPSTGGDCLRLVGQSEAVAVRDVTLRRIRGLNCDRSLIGVQRAVYGLLGEDISSEVVGDQALDYEPSGGPAFGDHPIVSDHTWRRLDLHRGPKATGAWAVTIQGQGPAVADQIRMEDSLIADGGIQVMDVGTVVLERLGTIRSLPTSAEPALYLRKRATELRVAGTTLERPAGLAGPVVKAAAQNGSAPGLLVLEGVTVRQMTGGAAIVGEGLGGLLLRGSRIDGASPSLVLGP